jgi:hypothetical protein
VSTGLEATDRIEVTQGLAAGESIVAQGHEGLYAGARVADAARGTASMPSGDAQKSMPGKEATPPVAERKEPSHAGH